MLYFILHLNSFLQLHVNEKKLQIMTKYEMLLLFYYFDRPVALINSMTNVYK